MRIIAIFALVNVCLGLPQQDLNIEQFEEKFHEPLTSSEEKKEAPILAKHEAAIDKEHELYEEGKANFDEALMPWDNLSNEEFMEEYTGLIDESGQRWYPTGLIETPPELAINSPEDQAILDAVYARYERQAVPTSYDAREKGWVTPVKSQSPCGSCAAFASAAMIETCLILAGVPRDNVDLSEQQLVDCGYGYDAANGCKGARISAYPKFINSIGGKVNHENNYPYVGNLRVCQNLPYWNAGAQVSNVVVEYNCNEDKMKALLGEYKSVATVINAHDASFHDYKGGIYDGCTSDNVTHAINIVGYGTENGINYWIAKNSWGTGWGEYGFFKVKTGTCGVGKACVVASCTASGAKEPPPAKVAVDFIPVACDISTKYGPNYTGHYTLTYENPKGGADLRATVDCAHSWCSYDTKVHPVTVKNSCLVICGAEKCGSK